MFSSFWNVAHIIQHLCDMIIDLHPRCSPGCHPGNVPCMPRCPSHSSPPVKHHQKSGGKISQQMVDHLQPPLESQVHVQWREERPGFFSARKLVRFSWGKSLGNCSGAFWIFACHFQLGGRSPGIGFDSVRSVMAQNSRISDVAAGEVFLRGCLHFGFARFGLVFVGSLET